MPLSGPDVRAPGAAQEALRVRVERAEGEVAAAACAAAIRRTPELEAQVQVVARSTLPRSGYETTRVVDA